MSNFFTLLPSNTNWTLTCFFFLKKRKKCPLERAPPLSLKLWLVTKSCYRGTKVEGPRPPRFHNMASPRASCWMASTEGERPLKMTSLRWLHMDHRMAKTPCHSAFHWYGPSPMDLQKASKDDVSIWATLANCHTEEAKGHVTKRCSQSSTAPVHRAHSVSDAGAMCCR